MAILDRYGNEIRRGRPITNEIVVASVYDRYATYPSNGLTPDRLAAIFREANQGDVSRQAELFGEMEEKDCHLGGVLSVRRLAVAGLEWEIHPASDSARDKRIAGAAREMLQYIENFDDALRDILDALGKGFSMSEIMWEIAGGRVWCKSINWVHPKRFTFFSSATAAAGMGAILKYPLLLTDDALTGDEVPHNKFIFHRSSARSGIATRGGILRPCAYMYLFKNYNLKDWVVFNDTFAVPMRVGKYRAGASAGEIDALRRAVLGLANDAAAVISDATVIELLESKLRGDTGSFESFARFCDSAMSKAVLGHSGSTDSTPGRLGGETEARDVRRDLLEADAKSLARTIRNQLIAPWTAFNFGMDAGVPKFLLPVNDAEDLERTARIFGILIKDAGFGGIGESHVHERFGIPMPAQGEKTLGAPAAVEPPVTVRANRPARHTPNGGENALDTVINRFDRGMGSRAPVPVETQDFASLRQLSATSASSADPAGYFAGQLSAEARQGAPAADPVQPWLTAARALLERSASIEDFRDSLLELWPEMPSGDLTDIITMALAGAVAAGMYEVASGD